MSRIGKQPVQLPKGVEAKVDGDRISVKGSKGVLTSPLFNGITAAVEGSQVVLCCSDLSDRKQKANFGMARALLASNVTGVSKGFEKVLELRGVGYRAQMQGRSINLSLGYSHPVVYELPDGVDAKVEQSKITISGIDKQKVGQVASEVRAYRSPEPYKGKGVRYVDENVIMKEGKKA